MVMYGFAVMYTSLPRPSGTPSKRRGILIPPFGHPLEAVPPFSSSLGRAHESMALLSLVRRI